MSCCRISVSIIIISAILWRFVDGVSFKPFGAYSMGRQRETFWPELSLEACSSSSSRLFFVLFFRI